MLNRVILMGRLVADPELRTVSNGANMCRFRIAVDRNFQQGQERKSDFFTCIAWRQTADFVMRYFRKGSMIAVEGEIHNNNYTDKDGKMQYTDEIAIDRVHFTGEKNNNPQGGYPQDAGYPQSGYQPRPQTQAAAPQIPPVQQPASSIAVGEGKDFVEIADDTDLPF